MVNMRWLPAQIREMDLGDFDRAVDAVHRENERLAKLMGGK